MQWLNYTATLSRTNELETLYELALFYYALTAERI